MNKKTFDTTLSVIFPIKGKNKILLFHVTKMH